MQTTQQTEGDQLRARSGGSHPSARHLAETADGARALRDHKRALLGPGTLDDAPDCLLDARPLPLYLDVDRDVGELLVHFLKGGDLYPLTPVRVCLAIVGGEPVSSVEPLYLRERHLADWPAPVRGALDPLVMDHHYAPIGDRVDIELQDTGTYPYALAEALKGILRGDFGSSPVGEVDRPGLWRYSCSRLAPSQITFDRCYCERTR